MIQLKWPDGRIIIGVEVSKNLEKSALDFYLDISLEKESEEDDPPSIKLLEGLAAFIPNFPIDYDNFSNAKLDELIHCLVKAKPTIDNLGVTNEFTENLHMALAVICYENPELDVHNWTEEMSIRLTFAFQTIIDLYIEVQKQSSKNTVYDIDKNERKF